MLVVGGVVMVIRARGGADTVARKGRLVGVLLALATSMLWALNAYAVSRGRTGVPPSVANTIRMAVALAVVPLACRVTMGGSAALVVPLVEARRAAWLFVLEGFGGSMLFLIGMTRSPLAIGAALSSLAPVVSVPFVLLQDGSASRWPRRSAWSLWWPGSSCSSAAAPPDRRPAPESIAYSRMEQQARGDALTNLANRRAATERLEQEARRTERTHCPLRLLVWLRVSLSRVESTEPWGARA